MSRVKPAYDISIDDNDLSGSMERLAESHRKSIDSIISCEILPGNLIKNITLSTTAKRVEHKLGRKPVGYIVVRQNANAVIYEQPDVKEELFLSLIASATVTVSLWIF